MIFRSRNSCANQALDRAAAALRAAHPDGPPADVYEPQERVERVMARVHALEWFGMFGAVEAFPELFLEAREARPC